MIYNVGLLGQLQSRIEPGLGSIGVLVLDYEPHVIIFRNKHLPYWGRLGFCGVIGNGLVGSVGSPLYKGDPRTPTPPLTPTSRLD